MQPPKVLKYSLAFNFERTCEEHENWLWSRSVWCININGVVQAAEYFPGGKIKQDNVSDDPLVEMYMVDSVGPWQEGVRKRNN